ncbi:MAG: Rrf2 family transcriptional regulator [Polyangia bacterium]
MAKQSQIVLPPLRKSGGEMPLLHPDSPSLPDGGGCTSKKGGLARFYALRFYAMDTILRISDAANLAIHAMAHIAKSGGDANHSVGEIAAEQGVSEAHLSKVMQRLVKVGLLTSRRGPGGGFVLGRAAGKISLLEILEAMDGPMSDCKCLLGRKKCLFGGCALGALLSHVNHQVRVFMASRDLTDLLGTSTKHALYLAGLGGPEKARGERNRKPSRRKVPPAPMSRV